MYDIDLTKQQIQYLIYLNDSEKEQSISSMAKKFSCSRVNSKYILDRMVKMGLIYKEKNNFKFTSFGKSIVSPIVESRNKIEKIFENIYSTNKEISRRYADIMISPEVKEISEMILYKYSIFEKDFIKDKVEIDYILNYLGIGKYKIYFNILKINSDKTDSNILRSMANMGFNQEAFLIINENESYISLKAKLVSRGKDGYKRQGILRYLEYTSQDKKYKLDVVEGEFRIPVSVIKEFYNIGGFLYQAGIIINTYVKVNMTNHSERAQFIFTINLLKL